MPAAGPKIRVATSPQVANQLEGNLLSELRRSSEQAQNTQITLEIRDDNDALIGGLVGSTSYGWLLIKVLWVVKSVRKMGYGRGLVEQAIQQARSVGCHSVWLDTSDKGALRFYQKIGFAQFGVLENSAPCPPIDHRRVFLEKRICEADRKSC